MQATKPKPQGRAVGKKKSSGSEVRRFNTLVRLDDAVAEKARKVAALKNISIGEYLSEMIGPLVDRDAEAEARKMIGKPRGESEKP